MWELKIPVPRLLYFTVHTTRTGHRVVRFTYGHTGQLIFKLRYMCLISHNPRIVVWVVLCDGVGCPPLPASNYAEGYGSIRGGILRIKNLRSHVPLHTTLYCVFFFRVVRYVRVIRRDSSILKLQYIPLALIYFHFQAVSSNYLASCGPHLLNLFNYTHVYLMRERKVYNLSHVVAILHCDRVKYLFYFQVFIKNGIYTVKKFWRWCSPKIVQQLMFHQYFQHVRYIYNYNF